MYVSKNAVLSGLKPAGLGGFTCPVAYERMVCVSSAKTSGMAATRRIRSARLQFAIRFAARVLPRLRRWRLAVFQVGWGFARVIDEGQPDRSCQCPSGALIAGTPPRGLVTIAPWP